MDLYGASLICALESSGLNACAASPKQACTITFLWGTADNCSYSCRRIYYHIEPVMGVLSSSAEMETWGMRCTQSCFDSPDGHELSTGAALF